MAAPLEFQDEWVDIPTQHQPQLQVRVVVFGGVAARHKLIARPAVDLKVPAVQQRDHKFLKVKARLLVCIHQFHLLFHGRPHP